MEKYQVFYRNNKYLTFQIFEDVKDLQILLPTIIIYAENGQVTYKPYIFKEVEYIKLSDELKSGFQLYFALIHDLYDRDVLDRNLKHILNDLQTGYYFPLGDVGEKAFDF